MTSDSTSDQVNRQWLFASRPLQMVGPEHFEYREVPRPDVVDGTMLVRNLYFSLDPAMRAWMWPRETYIAPLEIGQVMRSLALGQVVESRRDDFAPGELVVGTFGWQDYALVQDEGPMGVHKVPPGVRPTAMLGVLGVTGLTAYFGILDLGRPEAGQTVVISGAAGAVGSVAGQIAKTRGARVVGIAGGEAKCRWIQEEAGFDAAIDYKNENVRTRLRELCPQGIDVYFDNVGGPTLEAALDHLAMHARIVICGAISNYNAQGGSGGPRNYMNLLVKRARMEGFVVFDYLPRFGEAIAQMAAWMAEGRLRDAEDIVEGFENTPQALVRLFTGANLGKQLLKVADPPLPVA